MPVRSALGATVLAVAGIVAVAVVVTSIDSLAASPARFGYPWSARPDGTRPDDGSFASRLQHEDRIAAFAMLHSGEIQAANGRVRAYASEDVKGQISPTIVRGRAPTREREIALG